MATPRNLAALLAFFLLIGTGCLAASTPNFSGHWDLDGKASKLVLSPRSATLDIKHADPNLEVVTKTGDSKDCRTYKIDGVKRKIDVMGIDMQISARWEGSSLQTRAEGSGVIQSEKWDLIDGGKTLTINRTVSGIAAAKELFIYRKK